MPVSGTESRHDVAEAQLELQQELEQLQRQYRKMKNEKKSYKVETDNILRRQESEIEKLCKEHTDIEALLNVSLSSYNRNFDYGNVKKLNKLLVKDIVVQEVMTEDKQTITSLDKRIACTKDEFLNRQKKNSSLDENLLPSDQFLVLRQIRILENRVYNANIRFNRLLTKNFKLKSTIDYISFQKMRFRELDKKLNRVSANVNTEMDNVVESSLSYFHVRDEAQHRMSFLKEKAERDLALYNMELKDVMRIIDHDRKLRHFMNTKTEDRSGISEKAIFKRQNKRLCNLLDNLKLEAAKYEDIFAKIKGVTGIQDIDLLVSRFVKIEDENFAQFNYINELNTEIEALQEEIKERKSDMADMEQTSTQIDKRRREILGQLEVTFSEVSSKRQKTHEHYKRTKKILEVLKPKVEHVFKSVKCNRAAITDLLGNTAGLMDENVMAFLGIVEQRTNELLQIYCVQKLKYGVEDTNKHQQIAEAIFPVAALCSAPLTIKPPSIGEDSDTAIGPVNGLENRPLSFKEAHALVGKGILGVREFPKDSKKQVRV